MNYSWHLVPISGPLIGHSSYFPLRLHKLMASTIRLVTHQAERSFTEGQKFLFSFSFHLAFHSANTTEENKGEHYECKGK